MSNINKLYPLHIVGLGGGYWMKDGRRVLTVECGELLRQGTPNWGNAVGLNLAYPGSPVDNGNWCHKCVLSLWDAWTEEGREGWRELGIDRDSADY